VKGPPGSNPYVHFKEEMRGCGRPFPFDSVSNTEILS